VGRRVSEVLGTMDGFGDFDELGEHKGLCVLWVRKQKLW